jgi:hypothetical protein
VATPRALAAGLAVGWEGVRGLGAESQASRRRPLGGCLAHGLDLVTCVPRPCAGRQALAAWGRQPSAVPLLVAKPGRRTTDAPRYWHGHSVMRQVAGADSDGRSASAALRLVVVHASHLAHQHTPTSTSGPGTAATAGADHGNRVEAQWLACRPEAAAAGAA